MKNSIIISSFIFFALIFNLYKGFAQDSTLIQSDLLRYKDSLSKYEDTMAINGGGYNGSYDSIVKYTAFIQNLLSIRDSALINTFNAAISKVDKGFSVDITSNIDSVKINGLNKFYFVKGVHIDTTDGYSNKYGKIYVFEYSNHQVSLIDSTSSFMYDYYTLDFEVHKDTLLINYEAKRTSKNYTYTFNKHLQIYQLVSFSSSSFNNLHGFSGNYDIKKQVLSWKSSGMDKNDKMYDKSGKKKVILPQDFPIQLRQFEPEGMFMDDCDSFLSQ